jgi:hypothetical protein
MSTRTDDLVRYKRHISELEFWRNILSSLHEKNREYGKSILLSIKKEDRIYWLVIEMINYHEKEARNMALPLYERQAIIETINSEGKI